MKTVKEVSDMTGVSIRTLHYYDEIGLLKPSEVTECGYRLYDEKSLICLQQILFFKELDIPLKEIKEMMESSHFDKGKVLEEQKKLLILKRNKLNSLIDLIDKTLSGEKDMSFKEFDMSEYIQVLEKFKMDNKEKVIELYGSIEKFDEFINVAKNKEAKIAKNAIKEFGSIEKFTHAIKNNLDNISRNKILEISNEYKNFEQDIVQERNEKLYRLFKELVGNIHRKCSSEEVNKIATKITNLVKNEYEIFSLEQGDDYWYYMVKNFRVNPLWIKEIDNKFGAGSSKFIGIALNRCLSYKKPKSEILFDRLVSDLSKNPCSSEIQDIVKEIDIENRKTSENFNIETGENYIGYMSELYLNNSSVIKGIDREYGLGASRFIGEAFKFYSENKYEIN